MMCADVMNNGGGYVRRRVTEIELPHVEESHSGSLKIMRKPYTGMKELKRKPSFNLASLVRLIRKIWMP
jgi:hypothetical protein